MTEAEFKNAIAQLSQVSTQIAELQAGQQRSRELHHDTQERVDGIIKGVHDSLRQDLRVVHKRMDEVVNDVRAGLREDIAMMLEPVKEKQTSHSKKIDDHETRLRVVEAKGIRRDAVIGGASSVITLAIIEGLRFLQKLKGGG
jgi:hypothetical protein